jgi:coiled-coil domain-containing protein 55
LLKAAEVRRQENEVVMERVIMKERQQEDEIYGDKPKYVTGAFKQKMLEQQKCVVDHPKSSRLLVFWVGCLSA